MTEKSSEKMFTLVDLAKNAIDTRISLTKSLFGVASGLLDDLSERNPRQGVKDMRNKLSDVVKERSDLVKKAGDTVKNVAEKKPE